jgi:hypothetical protein
VNKIRTFWYKLIGRKPKEPPKDAPPDAGGQPAGKTPPPAPAPRSGHPFQEGQVFRTDELPSEEPPEPGIVKDFPPS